LHLNGSLFDAANLTNSVLNNDTMKHPGMITLNQTSYSAVVGGVVNATINPGTQMHGISLVFSDHSSVQHVRAVGHWNYGSAVTIFGGSKNEVSYSDTGGDEFKTTLGRGIWALATSHAYLHHNHVHHCAKHSLDIDAFTSSSVCWSNLCEDNLQEGIFVEESSHDNVIVDNTCRRNKNGIGVYTLDVGPVKNNMFFGNTLEDNSLNGITAGGYGHNGTKHSDSNVFFSNVADGNNKGSGANDSPPAQFNP
jgi:parallel beta-helix repeat protein